MLGLFSFLFGSVLCVSGFDVLNCRNSSVTLNVVLLEDENSPWSLKFVKDMVEMAVEQENEKNQAERLDFEIKVLFSGFNTTHYRRRGCGSSTCEAVEILKSLYNSSDLGCVMLGPSCTYATFQLVDQEVGLTLTIPIISAGSFGLSCDYKEKLTRLLPPARKISEFFVHFWHKEFKNLKPAWKTAYIYKKANNTEECFCVSPHVVFVLIDLYNEGYHANESSYEHMRNVLVVTMHSFRNYSSHTSWKANTTAMNDYVVAYHDAVVLFGHVMRKNLKEMKQQPFSGVIEQPFRNIHFEGMGGHYELDDSGDRDLNLSYETLFVFSTSENDTWLNHKDPDLPWDRSQLPSDKRANGMETQNIIMIVLGISVVMATAIAFILYRQNRRVRFDQKKWSHINSTLITPLDDKEKIHISLTIDDEKKGDNSVLIHKGRYDKKPVILKELRNTDGNFSEDQRIELNALLRIDYYNLTKFYGTVKFDCGVFGVFEFCERGSLRYVLNDKISYPDESFMDLEFKISVMYDIAKGMSYLHSSNVGVHGRLKSTNCVVDNRMVGISQKGDIYSFAIISQEIILRKSPFHTSCCSDTAEKLYRVQYPRGPNVFRPDLSFESVGETEAELFVLIKSCWEEDPEKRPDFKRIESALGKIFSNLNNQANASYMDNLIRRLQMYSRNLEHLVEERTALPVVRSLKETGRVEPELYDEVTIYFSDIVCFTTLCHHSTPMEVVDMLNDIYKNFDSILDHHDVYKVETIGDAYMVASGLPKRNGNRHAVDICLMALDILEFMGTYQLRHLPGIPLWIRIGIHSGPCAAGVVGNKMPRYCLFGDTVNTASRMESTGLPLRIHVSESTITILQRTDCQFECERRGETHLKGKGKEMTYWLTGVTGQKYNLPIPPTAENFQRLQQDLAERIVSTLDQRGNELRKTLSTRHRRTQRHSSDGQPEYLHLTDPTTYL
ncbi:Heat-stable enterotoxin receptor [Labeo rohita]|uniref:Guanylate cyclase n=1 Tax=Labeo rohita TaxID=84645 RepID=A0ABQ8MVP0_LABRO|nr:Heat-stable enterotoxin receptor [Labeo rohita]